MLFKVKIVRFDNREVVLIGSRNVLCYAGLLVAFAMYSSNHIGTFHSHHEFISQ
jgi:hypothetical protein